MDKLERTHNPQRYRKLDSIRCATYEEARKVFEWSDAERKRIRRRNAGHFDVVVYEPVPTAKEAASG